MKSGQIIVFLTTIILVISMTLVIAQELTPQADNSAIIPEISNEKTKSAIGESQPELTTNNDLQKTTADTPSISSNSDSGKSSKNIGTNNKPISNIPEIKESEGFTFTGIIEVSINNEVIERNILSNGIGISLTPENLEEFEQFLLDEIEIEPGIVSADLNKDGTVNGIDLTILLGSWGPCSEDCIGDIIPEGFVNEIDKNVLLALWGTDGMFDPANADLNKNGVIEGKDLMLLLGVWGECPEGESCLGDIKENSIVEEIDKDLLLALWGIKIAGEANEAEGNGIIEENNDNDNEFLPHNPDQPDLGINGAEDDGAESNFVPIIIAPTGLYVSTEITLEFGIIASNSRTDFVCSYRVDSDFEEIIPETEIVNCENPLSFEILEDGDHIIYLIVKDLISGNIEIVSSEFNVALETAPKPANNEIVDLGSFVPYCEGSWSCTDWGECSEETETQVRTCTNSRAPYCVAVGDKPAEVQSCSTELAIEELSGEATLSEGEEQNFGSILTGAFIGGVRNLSPLAYAGIAVFVGLLVALYIISRRYVTR